MRNCLSVTYPWPVDTSLRHCSLTATPHHIKHICTRDGGEPEYGIRIGVNIPYVCVAHLRCSPVRLKGCQPKKCKAGASEDPA